MAEYPTCNSGSSCAASSVGTAEEEALGTLPPMVELVNKYMRHTGIVDDLKASYNKLVGEDIPQRLARRDLHYMDSEGYERRIYFVAKAVPRRKETPGGKGTVPIWPQEMRMNQSDYNVNISGYPVFERQDPETEEWEVLPGERKVQELFQFPCMLKSNSCNLVVENLNEEELATVGEEPSDPGASFVIGGLPKWIFLVDRLRFHQNLVLPPPKSKTAGEAAEASLITTVKRQAAAKKKGPVKVKITHREKIYCKQTVLIESGTVQMKMTLGATNDLRCETMELGEVTTGSKIGNSINILHLMHLMIIYYGTEIDRLADDDPAAHPNPLCHQVLPYYVDALEGKPGGFAGMRRKVVETMGFMLTNLVESKYMSQILVNYADTKAVYEASGSIETTIKNILTWRKVNLTDKKMTREEKAEIRRNVITNFIDRFIFPNLPRDHIDDKLWSLAIMCARLMRVDAGIDGLSSRDAWANKRLFTPGENLSSIFKNVWRGVLGSIQEALNSKTTEANFVTMAQTKMREITSIIHKYMVNKPPQNGHGGSSKAVLTTEDLDQNNTISVLGQLTKVASPINKNSKSLEVRSVYGDGKGRICPVTTTDDKNCGFVKAKAITAYITRNIDITLQVEYFLREGIIKKWHGARVGKARPAGMDLPVMINGYFAGWCAHDARQKLVAYRLKGEMDRTVSVLKSLYGFLEIYSDAGRIVRPVLLVKNVKGKGDEFAEAKIKLVEERPDWQEMSIEEMLAGGYIDMLDAYEESSTDVVVASDDLDLVNYPLRLRQLLANIDQLKEENPEDPLLETYERVYNNMITYPYSYCDLHPTTQLSVKAATANYVGNSLSCRISFYTKMIGQSMAIAVNIANHKSGFFSMGAQHPIVEPGFNKVLGLHSQPLGHSCLIAFAALPMNQEDNVVASGRFLQFGAFRYNLHHRYRTTVEKATKTGHRQILARPSPGSVRTINGRDPTHALTRDGLPAIGSWLEEGDIVIGITQTRVGAQNMTEAEDNSPSVRMSFKTRGYVADITVRPYGHAEEVSILVLEPREPQIGDKITSRYAQKATFGEIRNHEDMPHFNMMVPTGDFVMKNGKKVLNFKGEPIAVRKMVEVTPDLIINPHSIASRMTIGFLHEVLAGSAALPTGETVDATGLEPYDPNKFIRILNERGFCRVSSAAGGAGSIKSSVNMVDGRTGVKIEADIYIGPAHYFQLPHIAEIKAYGRGWNVGINIDPFTKQPNKGRSRGGGLRFGNMEIYALFANMAPAVARDILMVQSDQMEVVICRSCSSLAGYHTAKQRYICNTCPADLSFGVIDIPYSYKLIQELLDSVGDRFRLDIETNDELLERLVAKGRAFEQRRQRVTAR